MKSYWSKSLAVLLCFLIGVATVSGQDALSVSIEGLDDDAYPTLTFEVTPNNEFGVPISDLTTDNFLISDDEGPLEISFVSQADAEKPNVDPEQPISIMLALDVSGSIVRAGSLDPIKEAAVQLREELGPEDEMGVLFFNVATDGSRVVEFDPAEDAGVDPREIRPTIDGGAVINFINEFTTTDEQAGTPLYDAIYRSIQVLNQDMSAGRRAVIVMTDGIDEGRLAGEPGSTGADLDLVIREANSLKIPVFTIGVGDNIDVVELRNISSGTGASEEINASVDDLNALFIAITDQLKTKYQISAEARVRPDNTDHTLNVQVDTDLGSASGSATFQARFPFQPLIDLNYTTNENELRTSNRLRDGVSGTIDLEPTFSARNPISRAEYYIDDVLVETVTEAPYAYAWDTTSLDTEVPHTLRIDVFDTADPPNMRSESYEVPVTACDTRCLAAENNFTTLSTSNFLYVLGAIVALIILLLAFILFSIIRGRSNRSSPVAQEPIYQPGPLTDDHLPLNNNDIVAPIPSPPAPGVNQGTINRTIVQEDFQPNLPTGAGGVLPPTIGPIADGPPPPPIGGPTGAGIPAPPPPIIERPDAGGYAPPAKTEVLQREPAFHAFLFNPSNGQQFRITEERTSIGRKPENQIHLTDSSVSGNHAAIKVEEKAFVIYDLGAANPVEVNGAAVREPVVLSDGDQLTFGRLSFVFKVIDTGV